MSKPNRKSHARDKVEEKRSAKRTQYAREKLKRQERARITIATPIKRRQQAKIPRVVQEEGDMLSAFRLEGESTNNVESEIDFL
jgi:hypothetical protein